MGGVSDVEELDVWLTPHDMDHLRGGQPVFKGVGDDTLIVLRSASWDELRQIEDLADVE